MISRKKKMTSKLKIALCASALVVCSSFFGGAKKVAAWEMTREEAFSYFSGFEKFAKSGGAQNLGFTLEEIVNLSEALYLRGETEAYSCVFYDHGTWITEDKYLGNGRWQDIASCFTVTVVQYNVSDIVDQSCAVAKTNEFIGRISANGGIKEECIHEANDWTNWETDLYATAMAEADNNDYVNKYVEKNVNALKNACLNGKSFAVYGASTSECDNYAENYAAYQACVKDCSGTTAEKNECKADCAWSYQENNYQASPYCSPMMSSSQYEYVLADECAKYYDKDTCTSTNLTNYKKTAAGRAIVTALNSSCPNLAESRRDEIKQELSWLFDDLTVTKTIKKTAVSNDTWTNIDEIFEYCDDCTITKTSTQLTAKGKNQNILYPYYYTTYSNTTSSKSSVGAFYNQCIIDESEWSDDYDALLESFDLPKPSGCRELVYEIALTANRRCYNGSYLEAAIIYTNNCGDKMTCPTNTYSTKSAYQTAGCNKDALEIWTAMGYDVTSSSCKTALGKVWNTTNSRQITTCEGEVTTGKVKDETGYVYNSNTTTKKVTNTICYEMCWPNSCSDFGYNAWDIYSYSGPEYGYYLKFFNSSSHYNSRDYVVNGKKLTTCGHNLYCRAVCPTPTCPSTLRDEKNKTYTPSADARKTLGSTFLKDGTVNDGVLRPEGWCSSVCNRPSWSLPSKVANPWRLNGSRAVMDWDETTGGAFACWGGETTTPTAATINSPDQLIDSRITCGTANTACCAIKTCAEINSEFPDEFGYPGGVAVEKPLHFFSEQEELEYLEAVGANLFETTTDTVMINGQAVPRAGIHGGKCGKYLPEVVPCTDEDIVCEEGYEPDLSNICGQELDLSGKNGCEDGYTKQADGQCCRDYSDGSQACYFIPQLTWSSSKARESLGIVYCKEGVTTLKPGSIGSCSLSSTNSAKCYKKYETCAEIGEELGMDYVSKADCVGDFTPDEQNRAAADGIVCGLCEGIVEPWWQVVRTNAYAADSINNAATGANNYIIASNTMSSSNSAGLQLTGDKSRSGIYAGTISGSDNRTQRDNSRMGAYNALTVNSASKLVQDYKYFANRLGVDVSTLPLCTNVADPSKSDEFHTLDEDADNPSVNICRLSDGSRLSSLVGTYPNFFKDAGNLIIFVDGSITIDRPVKIDDEAENNVNFRAIIASGTIKIGNNVGQNVAVSQKNASRAPVDHIADSDIRSLLIADKIEFELANATDDDARCDQQLVISGALLQLGDGDLQIGKTFAGCSTSGNYNRNYPVLIVIGEPDFILRSPRWMKESVKTLYEVK